MRRVPLTVRLRSRRVDRTITREVRGLSFESQAPGGFWAATVDLWRPLSADPDEIRQFGDLYVYDGRNGETVWQGRVEDLGRSSDGWTVRAVGTAAHARDRRVPLMYVDNSMERYRLRAAGSAQAGVAQVGSDAGAIPCIEARAPRGVVCAVDWVVGLENRYAFELGLKLARIDYVWDGGVTDAAWRVECVTRGGGAEIARAENLTTTGGSFSPVVVGTNFVNGRNVVELRLHRVTSSVTVANDTTYVLFKGVVVTFMRFNADGSEKTTGYGATVLAGEVVADLLGRLLSKYDGANARITNGTFAIDQLAFPDGVTPEEVLGTLVERFEPTFTWAAWAENPANGKFDFEFGPWPTTLGYQCTAADGYTSQPGAPRLLNRIRLRRRDAAGRDQYTTRTSTVAALDEAGLVLEDFVDLGDEVGSATSAQDIGDRILTERSTPGNAGTLEIVRPIHDATSGRMVEPWEVRPGRLIAVREVAPRPDALNSGRDAVTVFRLVRTRYDAATNTCTAELDSSAPSLANHLALRLQRAERRAKR